MPFLPPIFAIGMGRWRPAALLAGGQPSFLGAGLVPLSLRPPSLADAAAAAALTPAGEQRLLSLQELEESSSFWKPKKQSKPIHGES